MFQPSVDPTDPNSPKSKLLALLSGGAGATASDGASFPPDPTSPKMPPGSSTATTGSTTEPTKATLPGDGPTPPPPGDGFDPSGFDPNNPIDAVFLKNKYKNNGAGSGFGDLAYWRAHADQAARLDADQRGKGTDMPGPGDTGNTSFDPNVGRGGGGNGLFNPLSLLPGANLPNLQGSDPADSILQRIMQALTQYGGV